MLSALSALVVPKFGLFINLIGSFACTALAFILPVQMYNKTHRDEMTRKWKYLHSTLVIFGCVCGAISFVISIIALVQAFSENDPNAEQIAHPLANEDVT